jgi:transcription elongation GreA/GreB family factor
MPVVGFGDEINSITINSPMGKAIYKKSVGDTVSFSVGKNNLSVTIISKEKEFTKAESEREPE